MDAPVFEILARLRIQFPKLFRFFGSSFLLGFYGFEALLEGGVAEQHRNLLVALGGFSLGLAFVAAELNAGTGHSDGRFLVQLSTRNRAFHTTHLPCDHQLMIGFVGEFGRIGTEFLGAVVTAKINFAALVGHGAGFFDFTTRDRAFGSCQGGAFAAFFLFLLLVSHDQGRHQHCGQCECEQFVFHAALFCQFGLLIYFDGIQLSRDTVRRSAQALCAVAAIDRSSTIVTQSRHMLGDLNIEMSKFRKKYDASDLPLSSLFPRVICCGITAETLARSAAAQMWKVWWSVRGADFLA